MGKLNLIGKEQTSVDGCVCFIVKISISFQQYTYIGFEKKKKKKNFDGFLLTKNGGIQFAQSFLSRKDEELETACRFRSDTYAS